MTDWFEGPGDANITKIDTFYDDIIHQVPVLCARVLPFSLELVEELKSGVGDD